jgi:DNA-binding transcriptional ArsR family regulator
MFAKKNLTMQLQLPFFPTGTKLINETLGFREKDGFVYYLHNGDPIFNHSKRDRNSFRFILANLIVNKLCKVCELSKATGIDRNTIDYYVKMYQEQGIAYFFLRKSRQGHYYKMVPEKLMAIQTDLDNGLSVYRTALNNNVSASTITNHIKFGNLNKK